jgi:prophage regulatory protein
MAKTEKPKRILRFDEVADRVNLSREKIRLLEHAGLFPKRFKLTPGGHAAGYLESEIDEYIDRRIAESRGQSVTA